MRGKSIEITLFFLDNLPPKLFMLKREDATFVSSGSRNNHYSDHNYLLWLCPYSKVLLCFSY